MKKLLSLLLAMCFVLSLAACGDKNENGASGVKKQLTATLGSIYEDIQLGDSYRSSGDRFVEKQDYSFKMPADKAKAFIADTENKFAVFNVDINILNTTDKAYDFYYVSTGSAPDGVYVSRYSTCGELSLPANCTTASYFPAAVIVEKNSLGTNEIINLINKIEFTVLYCDKGKLENEEEIKESDLEKLKVSAGEAAEIKDGEVTALRADISSADPVVKSFRENEQLFKNAAAQYSMSETVVNGFIKDSSKWNSFTLNIKVTNNSGGDITIYTIKAANGTNGIYVCSISELGEFNIADKETASVPVTVLVNNEALGGRDLGEALKAMQLSLDYSRSPVFSEDGKESTEVIKTVEVQ